MRYHLLLLLLLAAVTPLLAKTYQVGDTFVAFTTKDQHDKPYTFAGGARLVIVAFDMATGKEANTFFEKQPANFLTKHQAIFLSNIHGMPGVARPFAMPKMRKYPHRILLADGEKFLERYPSKEEHLTVIALDPKGLITGIRFVDPKKAMDAIFAASK